MQPITLRQLETIIRECAGEDEDETTQPLEQTPEQPFTELGYDSLALLETHSRIKRDYNITLHDHDLDNAKTPQQLINLINTQLKTT